MALVVAIHDTNFYYIEELSGGELVAKRLVISDDSVHFEFDQYQDGPLRVIIEGCVEDYETIPLEELTKLPIGYSK